MFSLLRYLVEYVTLMLNFEPNSTREDPTSPYELFRGLKVDYKRQLRISFGDYAECHNPHITSNTVRRRTDPCLALLPTLNAQGSHLFYNLDTRSTCIRDTWEQLPFPADILRRCNNLAAHQRKKLRVQPTFAYEPDDLYAEMPIDPSPQHRYSTRSKGPAEKPAPLQRVRNILADHLTRWALYRGPDSRR